MNLKNNLFYLAFAGLLLSFLACNNEQTSSQDNATTLNFVATYDGQPLVMFQPVTFDQNTLKLSKVKLYVSNIRLLKTDGSEVGNSVTSLANLSAYDKAEAEKGVNIAATGVPNGNYTGVRFGIGVRSDENAKKPADYPDNSALSDSDMYWNSWNSFIFSKTEGTLETSNGLAYFSYHTGANRYYREVTLKQDFQKSENSPPLKISFDVAKILQNGSEKVDILSHPGAHSSRDTVVSVFITNQYQNAFEWK